jgi:Peptidase C13 family
MRRLPFLATCAAVLAASIVNAQSPPSSQSATSWEQNRPAAWELAQHQRLSAALAGLKPQRPGIVDAYVVVVALDADPVFAREATETTKVLARRFDASGRVILLAAGDASLPNGSPGFLAATLAAVAAKMNLREDALILYTTSHGAPSAGIVYRESNLGYGNITAERLSDLLDQLHIERRLIMISACFAGQFVGPLASPNSAIIAAADDDRTSFGCAPGNDWTFFGDALINNALRKSQPIEAAATQAFALINDWEFAKGLTSSKPRLFMGDQARLWLAAIEKRMPPGTTAKVGRPAIEFESAPSVNDKNPTEAK